jgi:dTDP-4-dehydrorhamnose reductase
MKILIVGNRGMLGTDLMREFGAKCEVLGVDIPELDITDAAQCRERVAELRPDVIVNAAALTAVDYCESHEEEALRVNGEGPGNLAAAATTEGARLVHYSTDYVFDGLKTGPYREEDEARPRSAYGRSKLRGEEMVRANCPDHLVLRTAWLFGCNGKNFIRTILKAARGGQALRVVEDQRGSPTYTRDLAKCTVRLVEERCRGTFHVTNSGACSWFELALYALRCAGIPAAAVTPVTSVEYPLPAPRPANSVLANLNLERAGLPALRSWREAVLEYINCCERN